MTPIMKTRPLRTATAAALLLAAPAALVAPGAPVAAAQGDLDRAVKALRGITTMKADFTQTDRQGQTLAGVLTAEEPRQDPASNTKRTCRCWWFPTAVR